MVRLISKVFSRAYARIPAISRCLKFFPKQFRVKLSRWIKQSAADVFLISYPKCGRTWLRVMLEKTLQLHFDCPEIDLVKSNFSIPPKPGIPIIRVAHDDNPHFKVPS